jgi:flagellar hook-length control protein FliK
MVMRLTPPELGTVRIEFITRDGMVTARLMAEDEGVRQALDRALPHIRAEVRGDHPSVDISVDRSEQRQAWGEGHARQERRDEPRAGQGRRPRRDEPVFTVDGAEPVAVATPLRAAQQLGGRVGPTLVDALA